MSENKLPQWAIDGLREAGLSAEGWRESHRFDYGVVIDGIGVQLWLQPNGKITAEFDPLPIPDAFRLAARLAAALENKPDPRVVELEAEVARLREGLEKAAEWLEVATRLQTWGNKPTPKEFFHASQQAKAALSEATNE